MEPKIEPLQKQEKSLEQKLQILNKYIESYDDSQILACLEKNRERAEVIGYGKNAKVFAVDDELIGHLCVKEMNDLPEIKYNSPEDEFEFQSHLNKNNIRTPYTVAQVTDTVSGKSFIVMERIRGLSIGDIIDKKEPLPATFNLKRFGEKLANLIKQIHEIGVLHRDLHVGNVMIDENCDPVLIDFGLSTYNSASSEDAYLGEAMKYNSSTKTYTPAKGLFLDDEKQVKLLQEELRNYCISQGEMQHFTNAS